MKQLNLFELAPSKDGAKGSKTQSAHWVISIDGASSNNPGPSGAGVFMKKDDQIVCQEGFYLGVKTNNQAEYFALLLALFFIKEYAKSDDVIRITSDSELLVKQIGGSYKVRNEDLKPLHALAMVGLKQKNIDLLHVMREDNVEADKLAKKAIKTKKPVPQPFTQYIKTHGITL